MGSSVVPSRKAGVANGGLRTVGAVLLATALGCSVAPAAEAARVSCSVTASSSNNVLSTPGFADAVVDLAAFSCGEGPRVIPIDERITAVASAMAEAVASVVATCEGEGNAQATVSGFSRAEARAEAVGRATVSVLAGSTVCELCQSNLNSMTQVMQTVAAEAVAEARLEATTFQFTEGAAQTMTAQDVQTVMEENIVDALATATGEIRASAADGCSAFAVTEARVGDETASCDIAVTAAAIATEIDAIAMAAADVQAAACDGGAGVNQADFDTAVSEVAVAAVQAVAQATAYCRSNGAPSVTACGLSTGTVNGVARAQARAIIDGMARVTGDECVCELATVVSAEEVEDIIAEATATALAEACTSGMEGALGEDFQVNAAERTAVAIAELVLSATGGAECSGSRVTGSGCVNAAECVGSGAVCAAPQGGTLRCCNPADRCTQLPGGGAPRCESMVTAARVPGAEVFECI